MRRFLTRFPTRKALQKAAFTRPISVSNQAVEAPVARLKPTAFSTRLTQSGSAISAAISRGRAARSGEGTGLAALRRRTARPRQAAPARSVARRRRDEPRSRLPAGSSSKAQIESAVLTWTVPSRADACRPCVARDRLPDRRGPALGRSPRSRGAAEPRELAADVSDEHSRAHLHDLGRLARKGGAVRRRDQCLVERRDVRRRARARRRASSSESTSSSRTSGAAGSERRLGEQQREQREALLALGAEAAQVAAARPRSDSSRCGPRPVVPRAMSASRRAVERRSASAGRRDRRARRLPDRARQARAAKRRRERGDGSASRLDESRRRAPRPLRPGCKRGARREAELCAPQRRVALRERRGVLLRKAARGLGRAAEHAIEVRAADRRPSLDRRPGGPA